jgi:hypothetical protein
LAVPGTPFAGGVDETGAGKDGREKAGKCVGVGKPPGGVDGYDDGYDDEPDAGGVDDAGPPGVEVPDGAVPGVPAAALPVVPWP